MGSRLGGGPEDQDPYQDQVAAQEGAQGCLAPRTDPWPRAAPYSVGNTTMTTMLLGQVSSPALVFY